MRALEDAVIGVVGASGAVGRHAAHALRSLSRGRLVLGARRAGPLRALADELGGPVEAVSVDVDSAESLEAFCHRCDVVLNCAGPSYRILDRVAVAALAAGADYVDVTGDSPVHDRLAGSPLAEGRRVLLSAGVLPGLSALLPRWFARGRGLREAAVHAGGLERCTGAAADDLLLSLPGGSIPAAAFGHPLAAWREGAVVEGALRAQEGARAPHFPGTVFVQPFLTGEARRLAASMGLRRLDWYNVHPGARTRAVLTSAVGRADSGPETAERLRRAADLDLVGNTPYYQMVYSLVDGSGAPHTLLARFTDSYRMTGRVGAAATAAAALGETPTGVHHAADVLDPGATVEALFEGDGTAALHLWQGAAAADLEEGAL
ncbi:saccharopine dehydrogenase NADP-binding domain-containing protein [Nocardiopsis ganjiahuensis]|uniref:saccharopine dehydrogenase NADP-binding domain-containing protein n=1 Tax=Nocardiopsis ganjiahuensis TaxID=239984 RepID=UPI000360C9F9|nr:saccharopine dehydrogenase NADP-binding domain-containing protein [Nocardiopsis ganjiahuensis]